eukprot:COSAG01_NODE_198_length_22280_cov_21.529775_26_plen_108_part_00
MLGRGDGAFFHSHHHYLTHYLSFTSSLSHSRNVCPSLGVRNGHELVVVVDQAEVQKLHPVRNSDVIPFDVGADSLFDSTSDRNRNRRANQLTSRLQLWVPAMCRAWT